jgi:NTP pyrophosphatase (non-canonical NTP hydrolase)
MSKFKPDMEIKINDYVEWTNNTLGRISANKFETEEELELFFDRTHMLLGIITELGELADVFKKSLAYDSLIDWTNVKEEIGDMMFYIAGFCLRHNIDLENIINVNVAKLETRYPEKFSNWRANNRDLDKERDILEKN